MASGRAFYDACCSFEGEPYSTDGGRTDPNSGYKDCSGLVAAGFEVVQGHELGAYVSTTIFEQSVNAGLEIPLMAAENIVGALIFKPENPFEGWGANGHIAVSDGYGGTIEATPPRVQRLPLSYNAPWSSRAAYAIELDYSNYGEGGAEPAPKRKAPPMGTVFQSELTAIYVEGASMFLASPDMIARATGAGCPLLYVDHEELMLNYSRVLGIDLEE